MFRSRRKIRRRAAISTLRALGYRVFADAIEDFGTKMVIGEAVTGLPGASELGIFWLRKRFVAP